MKRVLLAFSPMLLASSMYAAQTTSHHNHEGGVATVTTSATLYSPPEYVEFTISVSSKCYGLDAINGAHDGVVAQLQTMFKGYFDEGALNKFNGVEVVAGDLDEYSHTIYHRDSSTEERVCQGTYQKHTTITIKTSDINNISQWQHDILKDVRPVFAQIAGDDRTPSTRIRVYRGVSRICDDTQKSMKADALTMCCKNAQQELQGEFASCNIDWSSVKCISVGPVQSPNYGRSVGYAKSAAFESAGGDDATVEYTQPRISVYVERQYTFSFKPWQVSCSCSSGDFDSNGGAR